MQEDLLMCYYDRKIRKWRVKAENSIFILGILKGTLPNKKRDLSLNEGKLIFLLFFEVATYRLTWQATDFTERVTIPSSKIHIQWLPWDQLMKIIQWLQSNKEKYLPKICRVWVWKTFFLIASKLLRQLLASFGLKIVALQDKMHPSIVIYTKRSD